MIIGDSWLLSIYSRCDNINLNFFLSCFLNSIVTGFSNLDPVKENSKQPIEAYKSKSGVYPPKESCYNKFGCPFNAKQAMRLGLTEENSLTEKGLELKFTQVKLQGREEWVSFCELCYQCYDANEKCDFCCQVYFSDADDAEVDGKMWISCDNEDCLKWNHPDCEIQHGPDPEYREVATELRRQAIAKKEAEKAAANLNESVVDGGSQDNKKQLSESGEKQGPSASSSGRTKEIPDQEVIYYCLSCRQHPPKTANTTKQAKKNAKGKGVSKNKNGKLQAAKKGTISPSQKQASVTK